MEISSDVAATEKSAPVLLTRRLRLRVFELSDAAAVTRLAGAREIASTTLTIPHPYPEGAAELWIASPPKLERGEQLDRFAITDIETGELIGAVGLTFEPVHSRAEMGYWIGVPYWNRGFATEAAQRVLEYGFDDCRLHRIYAHHFTRNPASGRVLQKIGMRFEGILRHHVTKLGKFEDLACYGALATDRLEGDSL